jgi:hypothetical protein
VREEAPLPTADGAATLGLHGNAARLDVGALPGPAIVGTMRPPARVLVLVHLPTAVSHLGVRALGVAQMGVADV